MKVRLCRRSFLPSLFGPLQVRGVFRVRCRSGDVCVHGRFAGSLGRQGACRSGERAGWKSKPSWYVVTTEDRMIPAEAQRMMASRAGSQVVEVKGSHAVFVSQARAVAAVIERAATPSLTAGR
jgi:hypothetical protein